MLRKIKAQKVKDMSKKSGETPSLDLVTITSQEYPEYLKRAYKEEKFPKPRNIIGLAKDLPVPEMEKLMLTNITAAGICHHKSAYRAHRGRLVARRLLSPGQMGPWQSGSTARAPRRLAHSSAGHFWQSSLERKIILQ